jgi:hypothetical protein
LKLAVRSWRRRNIEPDGDAKSVNWGLELLGKARLFQDAVSGMTGQDSVVDGKASLGNWTFPDFVIAPSLPNEITARRFQNLFQFWREAFHAA